MPRLQQYDAPVNLDLSPQIRAAQREEVMGHEEAASIQQGANGLQRGLNSVEQHVAQTETSSLSASLAQTEADLTTKWRSAVQQADPNDHDLAQNFMENTVKPALSGLGDNLMTSQAQDLYTRESARITGNMFVKSAADQSTLAGEAAVMNMDTWKNAKTNLVRSDPSSFASSVADVDNHVNDLVTNSGLPREEGLKLAQSTKSDLAKSAFYGMADANPVAAKAALARGDFNQYVDGVTAKGLDTYADVQSRAQMEAQKAADAETKKQQKGDADAFANQITASTIGQDGGVTIPPGYYQNVAKLAMMPGVDPSLPRAMIEAGRATTNAVNKGIPIHSDPSTVEDFRERMTLPPDDPRALSQAEVYSARADNRLSTSDFNLYRGAVTSLAKDPAKTAALKQFNFALSTMKPAFTNANAIGLKDPNGEAKYYAFVKDAQAQFENHYSDGTWGTYLQAGGDLSRMATQYATNKKGATMPQASQGAAVGSVVQGYRFNGGDWHDQKNWTKVGQ